MRSMLVGVLIGAGAWLGCGPAGGGSAAGGAPSGASTVMPEDVKTAGRGTSRRGDQELNTEIGYRIEKDQLEYFVRHAMSGKGSARFEYAIEVVGFEVQEGAGHWEVALNDAQAELHRLRLRASAPGTVLVRLTSSGGNHEHRFVHEQGRLRLCKEGECDRMASSATDGRTGKTISVTVKNHCPRAFRYVLVPDGFDQPAPGEPVGELAPGSTQKLELDAADWLRRVDEDGRAGGGVQVDDGGTMEIGEDCTRMGASG